MIGLFITKKLSHENTIIVLLALSVAFVSCEKFDEGGSVGKADKVITENLWVIESATDLEDGSNIKSDYAGDVWELSGTNSDTYWIDRLDSEAMWLTLLGAEELRFIPF